MKRGKVFISYRRDGGAELARNVRNALQQRRFDVFLDVEDLRGGAFNEALYKQINEATDVVIILTPGSLDRCFDNDKDWFRLEVAYALSQKKNVVPILHRGFQWPRRPLPDDLSGLSQQSGLPSSHDFFGASMDRLADKLLVGRGRSRGSRTLAQILAVSLFLIVATVGLLWWRNQDRPNTGKGSTTPVSAGTTAPPAQKQPKDTPDLRSTEPLISQTSVRTMSRVPPAQGETPKGMEQPPRSEINEGRLSGAEPAQLATSHVTARPAVPVIESPTCGARSEFTGPGNTLAGAFSSDGRQVVALFSGTYGNPGSKAVIRAWDLESRHQVLERLLSEHFVAVDLSTDGTRALVAYDDSTTVGVVDVAAGTTVARLRTGRVEELSFSPDARQALVAGPEDFQLWDLRNNTLVRRLALSRDRPRTIIGSPDGRLLAMIGGTADQRLFSLKSTILTVWDTVAERELWAFEGRDADVFSLAISADGQRLLTGGRNKAEVVEMATGRRLQVLTGYQGATHAVAFSRNGQRAVSGGQDSVLRLWELDSGRLLTEHELGAKPNTILNVDFSPSDRFVLAASSDGLFVCPVSQ